MYFYACGNIPPKHDSHKANTLWKLFHSFQCEIQELKSGPLTWCHVSLIGNHLTGPIISCYLGNTKFLLVVLHFHKIAISSWGESVTSQTHGFFFMDFVLILNFNPNSLNLLYYYNIFWTALFIGLLKCNYLTSICNGFLKYKSAFLAQDNSIFWCNNI